MKLQELFNYLGEERIKKMAYAFYDSVWNDEQTWFSELFRKTQTKQGAQVLLVCYLGQKWGGPPLYGGFEMPTERVKSAHDHVPVDEKGIERWLHHWDKAINSVEFPKDENAEEAKRLMRSWARNFGISVKNNPKEEDWKKFHDTFKEDREVAMARYRQREQAEEEQLEQKVKEQQARLEAVMKQVHEHGEDSDSSSGEH